MSTYHALYIASLEERISAGGRQEDIDAAFAEYNMFNQEAFDKWVAALPVVQCASCGVAFKPEGKVVTTDILCKDHTP